MVWPSKELLSELLSTCLRSRTFRKAFNERRSLDIVQTAKSRLILRDLVLRFGRAPERFAFVE